VPAKKGQKKRMALSNLARKMMVWMSMMKVLMTPSIATARRSVMAIWSRVIMRTAKGSGFTGTVLALLLSHWASGYVETARNFREARLSSLESVELNGIAIVWQFLVFSGGTAGIV
jgi:hypothetical protein